VPIETEYVIIYGVFQGQVWEFELPEINEIYGGYDFNLVWVRPNGLQLYATVFGYFSNDLQQYERLTVGGRYEL